jgi:hypothetical protein
MATLIEAKRRRFCEARLAALGAERARHKAAALAAEGKAARSLARGDREGWEFFAAEADTFWAMNAAAVADHDGSPTS